jgi:hypothetical protein
MVKKRFSRRQRNDLQAAVEYFEMVERNNGPDAMVHFGPVARMEMLRQYKLASTALTALRDVLQRQPDPETGLVRCGCGGKAKCLHHLTPDGDYAVKCGKCKIMTDWFNSPEDAIKAFNTAMGWKGGAE